MALEIVFDQAIDGRPPIRFGTFPEVQVTHRRVRAGELEVVRHFDGGWHVGDGSFLELRLEPARSDPGRRVQIDFNQTWATRAQKSERATAVRLYGDRLLAGKEDRWIASNNDDARCWIAEATGLASAGLTLTAS